MSNLIRKTTRILEMGNFNNNSFHLQTHKYIDICMYVCIMCIWVLWTHSNLLKFANARTCFSWRSLVAPCCDGDHDDDTMEAKDNDSNEVYCHVKCDAVNYTDLHESLHKNDDSKVMYIKNGCT